MAIRAVLFDWGGTLVRDDSLVVGAPAAVVASREAAASGSALLLTACVWLPAALLAVATVSVPGVVSATSSALTVSPAPAPTARTPAL